MGIQDINPSDVKYVASNAEELAALKATFDKFHGAYAIDGHGLQVYSDPVNAGIIVTTDHPCAGSVERISARVATSADARILAATPNHLKLSLGDHSYTFDYMSNDIFHGAYYNKSVTGRFECTGQDLVATRPRLLSAAFYELEMLIGENRYKVSLKTQSNHADSS